MEIDRRMNLVIPLERESGDLHVHATPISSETFKANYRLISRTFDEIYSNGAKGLVSAPRVAGLYMMDITKGDAEALGAEPDLTLLSEIIRMANLIVPGEKSLMPLADAKARGLIDDDEESEVANALVFFTCISWMHKKKLAREILGGVVQAWGMRLSSLAPMELKDSLQTSSGTDNSGVKVEALSETS